MPPQMTYDSALPSKIRKHENHIYTQRLISRESCSTWTVLYAQCTSAMCSWKQ